MGPVIIVENSPGQGAPFTRWLKRTGAGVGIWRAWLWRGGRRPGGDSSVGRFGTLRPDMIEACTGAVFTGDFHNVTYGLLPRHERQLELLEKLDGKRVFASCFSHQMLAEAKGGRVGRRDRRLVGWERVSFDTTSAALPDVDGFSAVCLNIDEVVEAPPGARVLASSPNCRFHVLAYGENILTCQSHPELSTSWPFVMTEGLGLVLGATRALRDLRAGRQAGGEAGAVAFMRALSRWLST